MLPRYIIVPHFHQSPVISWCFHSLAIVLPIPEPFCNKTNLKYQYKLKWIISLHKCKLDYLPLVPGGAVVNKEFCISDPCNYGFTQVLPGRSAPEGF